MHNEKHEIGYRISGDGQNCGRDSSGVFHCVCGKCRPLNPAEPEPSKADTEGTALKRRGRLQAIAFILVLLTALFADGLMERCPLALCAGILFAMAGTGCFLIWLSNYERR